MIRKPPLYSPHLTIKSFMLSLSFKWLFDNGVSFTLYLLTALVTLLEVAVAGLHRGALTVVIDTVTGAATLLDSPPT